jgi:hypothetical protein
MKKKLVSLWRFIIAIFKKKSNSRPTLSAPESLGMEKVCNCCNKTREVDLVTGKCGECTASGRCPGW